MDTLKRPVIFALFFLSGFCGLVYQVVWTRLAFATFGIITPVLSVVISVFMLGLALGSWAGGRWISSLSRSARLPAIYFYALAELVIGLGAFAVPWLFGFSARCLLPAGESNSLAYLIGSAAGLSLSLLPWCFCMGVTYPWMMAHIREHDSGESGSFSFLYLANVLGAMSGTLLTAFVLIELFGFHDTLHLAAGGNFLIAGVAVWLGSRAAGVAKPAAPSAPVPELPSAPVAVPPAEARQIRWLLFATGFISMALEVVWTRAFTPVLKTQVYSFALILAVYLGATFLGSWLYRARLRRGSPARTAEVLGLLCLTVFLPILINDVRLMHPDPSTVFHPRSVMLLLASIAPFCGLLGYLTPALIDRQAAGAPALAGSSYALNVLGCILGPLFAAYVLLPSLSEQISLTLLGLPLLILFVIGSHSLPRPRRAALGLAAAGLALAAATVPVSLESSLARSGAITKIRRDHTASVVALRSQDTCHLLVNGIGMTLLTPVTKLMVHLPAASLEQPPQSALVICFGMGTAFRSALSWDVPTTAVELVPGVPETFDIFHANAAQCLASTNAHVVIDDGRRFLDRTREQFDIVVVDPPPPPEAAGSSLLYSEEFYQLVRKRLKPQGILQAWLVQAEPAILLAELRSIRSSFLYVRCFAGFSGLGWHVVASDRPLINLSPALLASRLPAKARADLLEWADTPNPADYLNRVLSQEVDVETLLRKNPGVRLVDDLPYNEYFLLRRLKLL
jgi:predicted membrane-bound spermidine synthase